MANAFFWYDVMTTDPRAARKFYGDVVGWGAQDAPGGMGYTLFTVGGEGVAGLMAIPEEAAKMGARPCWTGYIAVDDVDATMARLTHAGGKVLRPPMDVSGIIRFAVVADPQGAAFIIAKGMGQGSMTRHAPGTPGTVGWHELYAHDGQSAFAFYEKMFDWSKADDMDMGPMGVYRMFRMGGSDAVGGMMAKPAEVPAPFWNFYTNVPALDAAIAKITAGGGQVVNGPMEVPGGQWIVQAKDPQGVFFSLVAPQR